MLGADDYIRSRSPPTSCSHGPRADAARRRAGRACGTLTARELEVLQLLAEGLTHHEISRSLVIAPKTCAKHIERILEKLSVHSRAQAVAIAYRDELVAAPR